MQLVPRTSNSAKSYRPPAAAPAHHDQRPHHPPPTQGEREQKHWNGAQKRPNIRDHLQQAHQKPQEQPSRHAHDQQSQGRESPTTPEIISCPLTNPLISLRISRTMATAFRLCFKGTHKESLWDNSSRSRKK